jgi:hypothetical protein
LTPQRVQAWKRSFLAKAAPDPLSQRQAKVSVNGFLHRAKSLFSPKITRHLSIPLPDPLPFTGVEFEPRQSMKYRSGVDLKTLIETAGLVAISPSKSGAKMKMSPLARKNHAL